MRSMAAICVTLLVVIVFTTGCPNANHRVGNTVCLSCHDGRSAEDMTRFTGSPHADLDCETCHGPGYLHTRSGGREGLLIEVPASTLDDASHEFCGECHADEETQYVASKHWTNPYETVRCIDCHDIHSGEAMRADATDNTLCRNCHAPYGFADDDAVNAHTHHPVTPADDGASRCTICHMPPLDRVEQFEGPLSHTFEPIPPSASNDAIADNVTPVPPSSCTGVTGCHDGTNPGAPVFNVDNTADNTVAQEVYDLWFGTGGR